MKYTEPPVTPISADDQRDYRAVSYREIKAGRGDECVMVSANDLYWLMKQARLAELLQEAKDVAYSLLNIYRRGEAK